MSPFATFHRSSRLCPSLWKSFSSCTQRSVLHTDISALAAVRAGSNVVDDSRRYCTDSQSYVHFLGLANVRMCIPIRKTAVCPGRLPQAACLRATGHKQYQVIEMQLVETQSEQMIVRHIEQLQNRSKPLWRYGMQPETPAHSC